MEFHEYANLFPMLPDAELQVLAADIKKHGLNTRITTYQGKILDGRNRWRACEIAGVQPNTIEFTGSDPLAFAVSSNLHRRHLNESQRAIVAAEIANLPAHRPSDKSAHVRTSQTEAAKLLNVGERTVQSASKVLRNGAPELIEAVKTGTIAAKPAAELAKLPAARQVEVLAEGPEAVKAKARRSGILGRRLRPPRSRKQQRSGFITGPLWEWIMQAKRLSRQ